MNLHTHTNYCDGKSEPISYVQAGIELGWNTLGFSAHAPLPFLSPWAIKNQLIESYIKEISALKIHYKNEISLQLGWELDYLQNHGLFALNIPGIQLADFYICSIHYLQNPNKDEHIGGFIEIDGDFANFQFLLKSYDNDLKILLEEYLKNLKDLIKINLDKPKIIGHIDKIAVNAEKTQFFKPIQKWFHQQVVDILDAYLGDTNANILEINTRSYYHLQRSVPYPCYEILDFIHEKKIPCLLSSDAHHPYELNQGFEEIKQLIQRRGLDIHYINPKTEIFCSQFSLT